MMAKFHTFPSTGRMSDDGKTLQRPALKSSKIPHRVDRHKQCIVALFKTIFCNILHIEFVLSTLEVLSKIICIVVCSGIFRLEWSNATETLNGKKYNGHQNPEYPYVDTRT